MFFVSYNYRTVLHDVEYLLEIDLYAEATLQVYKFIEKSVISPAIIFTRGVFQLLSNIWNVAFCGNR